jgi:Protein of unknown function (DUF4239)
MLSSSWPYLSLFRDHPFVEDGEQEAATVTALPIGLSGVLFVVVLPALAIGAQLLIRRSWPALADGEHNDVAGFIIAVVGVIYAVLLAFVVIVSWEDFSKAESTVGQEASALRSIYRESQAFPPDVREHIRADVLRYASTAIDVEWPAMAEGKPGSPEVYGVLDDMSQSLAQLPANTPVQQAYLGAEADRFNQLVGFRSERLDYVEKGVPAVLWIALGVGAVVTIGFAMIFGLRSTMLHVIMTASLSAVIGVLLFVSVAIDHPFEGDVVVDPAPLERVISDFRDAP